MISELFRQLQIGLDFDSAKEMLDAISSEEASRLAPGAPYTILQNLAHAEVWQSYWLRVLDGERTRPGDDWPSPESEAWAAVRRSFLEGFDRAVARANGDVSKEATTRLVEIALHDSYHLGQIALLRRLLAASSD